MAAKKKTPAKKKPALKKKPAAKSSRKAAPSKSSGKSSGKKSTGKKPASKARGKRPAARTSKRPSPSRKISARKAAPRAPKAKVAEAPEALALARSIASVATEKKAEQVMIIDVRVHSAAVGYDYVVLATGESDRQLSAIHEGVDDLLKPQGKKASIVEASADWVCVTYDEGVVAHFFTPDRRELMDLEGLWSDAPRVSA